MYESVYGYKHASLVNGGGLAFKWLAFHFPSQGLRVGWPRLFAPNLPMVAGYGLVLQQLAPHMPT